jgi:hypothetical protein
MSCAKPDTTLNSSLNPDNSDSDADN